MLLPLSGHQSKYCASSNRHHKESNSYSDVSDCPDMPLMAEAVGVKTVFLFSLAIWRSLKRFSSASAFLLPEVVCQSLPPAPICSPGLLNLSCPLPLPPSFVCGAAGLEIMMD